jgi:hypothetical protein
MLKAVGVFEALAKRMRDRFHVQAKSFARLIIQKLKVGEPLVPRFVSI